LGECEQAPLNHVLVQAPHYLCKQCWSVTPLHKSGARNINLQNSLDLYITAHGMIAEECINREWPWEGIKHARAEVMLTWPFLQTSLSRSRLRNYHGFPAALLYNTDFSHDL